MQKEAKARLKINTLLEESGWRLLEKDGKPANVQVEANVKLTEMGDDFENISDGFIDYLLLDERGFPICVLEAKSEDKDALIGKEQARIYANAENIRFILLSNGNIHYFWDKEKWNPTRISHFPRLESFQSQENTTTDTRPFVTEHIESDYVVRTQFPRYREDPRWQESSKQAELIKNHGLKFLRKYQISAIESVQRAVQDGKNRFLFEMATGTGKTLTSAALIKLFLKSGLAKRVLFLVDRLELEDQAKKAFVRHLGNDFQTAVFKENRDDWRKAEIVVTTIQSISYNNKYLKIFTPTDFDLIISDEAHRSISGSNRTIFEYFIAYKLGLTATPKDYLKNLGKSTVWEKDPRELEKRQLLSTYQAFGCESGDPTFRYSLLDGVGDPDGPYLVNPTVINCKTDITTDLLSKEWYAVDLTGEDGETEEVIYKGSSFERKFFSEDTNRAFCEAFMQNALRDPISGEIGKTIFFCVSRHHAGKITQLLNDIAHTMFPGKYQSDFALQITSDIPSAQQFTINFANGNLNGYTNWKEWYKSSKTRVCVTVGMMTTGYDCEDILNLALARPIFSPSDFVQMKWRGTRTFTFDFWGQKVQKIEFKLFDFFENYKYFEEEYPYDEVLSLPKISSKLVEDTKPVFEIANTDGVYESSEKDYITVYDESQIGSEGMRIDRELYIGRFEKTLKDQFDASPEFAEAVVSKDYDFLEEYIKTRIFDRPSEFYSLKKLREGYKTDRKVWLWEIVDHIFFGSKFRNKKEIALEEFEKYLVAHGVVSELYYPTREFFTLYLTKEEFRTTVNNKHYRNYAGNPEMMHIFTSLGREWLEAIPTYIHDHVPLNQFY